MGSNIGTLSGSIIWCLQILEDNKRDVGCTLVQIHGKKTSYG